MSKILTSFGAVKPSTYLNKLLFVWQTGHDFVEHSHSRLWLQIDMIGIIGIVTFEDSHRSERQVTIIFCNVSC